MLKTTRTYHAILSVLYNVTDSFVACLQHPQLQQWSASVHLITGCNLCVGSNPTSGKAEELSQQDPGC